MYHELIYLLDLCIYSYQLHAQTLIWPMDPYYEEWAEHDMGETSKQKLVRRQFFIDELRDIYKNRRVKNINSFSGPGEFGISANGWINNDKLDPILADYTCLNPWLPGFTRPSRDIDQWIIYNTPIEIRSKIKALYMVQFDQNAGPYATPPLSKRVDIHKTPPAYIQGATDSIYCFEGCTGAVCLPGEDKESKHGVTYAAMSMMGYVLVKPNIPTNTANNPAYEIYIVFRGSRSSKIRKESSSNKSGNPDWVTDFETKQCIEDKDINPHGACARGFRTAIKLTLPNIIDCLSQIEIDQNHLPPSRIYVTGHSLGGALASLFTSAVMLGEKYGPFGKGKAMPVALHSWPWPTMKLVTYASPFVGKDKKSEQSFQRSFAAVVQSTRVWLKGDVITTKEILGTKELGAHVGEGYKIPAYENLGIADAHDPFYIRRALITDLKNNNFDMKLVPGFLATYVKQAASDKEPWQKFKTCKQALAYMQAEMRADYPTNTPLLNQILPNYHIHLVTFLEIIIEFVKKQSELRKKKDSYDKEDPDPTTVANIKDTALKKLITDINSLKNNNVIGAQLITDVYNLWNSIAKLKLFVDSKGTLFKPQGNKSSDNFNNYLGLCLYLWCVSQDPNFLSSLINLVGDDASRKFKDLEQEI